VISVVGRIVNHSIYEYGKGIRPLFMLTMPIDELPTVLARLRTTPMASYVHRVDESRINLFFGAPSHVQVVRTFVDKPLSRLTPQEDFMLGMLLGYDPDQQCRRLLGRIGEAEPNVSFLEFATRRHVFAS
jgi:hypothetical protein